MGQRVGAGGVEDSPEGAAGLVETHRLCAQNRERGRDGIFEADQGVIPEERL